MLTCVQLAMMTLTQLCLEILVYSTHGNKDWRADPDTAASGHQTLGIEPSSALPQLYFAGALQYVVDTDWNNQGKLYKLYGGRDEGKSGGFYLPPSLVCEVVHGGCVLIQAAADCPRG